MEKYLTPIQYQQYLHDKAYQAANAQVPIVFIASIVVVAVIVVGVIIYDRAKRAQHKDADLQWEVWNQENQ